MGSRLATVLWCLLFSNCGGVNTSREEVARLRAPTEGVDAVLVENNEGEGSDFSYSVYVVASGGRAPRAGEVAWLGVPVRNHRAYGANLRWAGPSALRIEYWDAHQAERRRAQAIVGADTVTIALQAGVFDSLAPPGGMFYNLRRARR